MRFQEITPSMILLLVGGILAIVVQLPIINEFLPMVADDTDLLDGGYNLLGGFGDYPSDGIDGWTMLGLPGILWWLLLIIGGLLCVIPGINKFQKFLPEMEMPVPGGLPFLLAIIGALLQIIVALLIFIGDAEDSEAYGLSMLDMPTGAAVGFGFYVMIIAAIVSIVGAILLYLEESAA